ncbi:MAG TPA: ABC transporter substrate-binding protein [Candidatus Binatia bacterium]|jgi:putative ABC transport system substrate-binding protein|nr:ABC transporter substrate-binding protein [Candidatus Binatia bacterium]
MKKNIFGVALVAVLFTLSFPATAQQPRKVPLIGFLEGASISESQGIEPFRQGLRELGYVDGQNIIVEVRAIEGKPDRIPDIVAEFLRRKVDVIFTPVTAGAQAAKKATPTIPIVVVVADPVGSGLVASLARPDGNVTGLSGFAELAGKRLEIVKDTVPNLNRVAVFWWNAISRSMGLQLKETEAAASVLGVKLQALEVRGPEDFESAFKSAVGGRAGALIALRSPGLVNHRKQFLKLAEEHRLPAMYDDRNFVEPGGLMSYGTDRADLFRRAAVYVDKILKGAKPADLPVEQPKKFELVINLKTANQIGLTIPPHVLARADRVIKDAPR